MLGHYLFVILVLQLGFHCLCVQEIFEQNGASKFWRHFDAYTNFAILSKNQPPVCIASTSIYHSIAYYWIYIFKVFTFGLYAFILLNMGTKFRISDAIYYLIHTYV